MTKRSPITFEGAEANRLVGDLYGAGDGPVALLLHGGGQTRHSWEETAFRMADAGWRALAVDQRGHGESDHSPTGSYSFEDFAADAVSAARDIHSRFGIRPVAVGASLGGVSALLAEGRAREPLFDGLVLVDVTPRMDPQGVARIEGFMGARMREGFATLEEAADSISAYLPHRKRPRALDGLAKNLRRDADGRYRWHWDPRFIDGPRPISTNRAAFEAELVEAARDLAIPTLLVRGRSSELVSEAHAREFLELASHAEYVDVSGAGHMVAGDRNDVFTECVLGFLHRFEAESCRA